MENRSHTHVPSNLNVRLLEATTQATAVKTAAGRGLDRLLRATSDERLLGSALRNDLRFLVAHFISFH